MILTNVSYFSITLVSVMFAGHLGKTQLAASTLANSWASVTGFIILIGLSGALETLCGQGYGAKMYRMLGIYLQSSIIISLFYSIIASFIWFYSEPILIFLHQEPHVAKMAAIYLRHLIPGLFAYAILQCILRFLQTLTVKLPLVICSVVPLVIHVGLTYALVYRTVLGFKGAALAAAITLWFSVIMLGHYVHYSGKFKDTWKGLSRECFNHLLPNMKLAIPSAVMVCLEYWAFEVLVILAGSIPNSEDSTSLIAMCLQTDGVAFMISCGFSAAVSTRVANELGAGNTDRAKNAVGVSRGCGLQHLAAWSNLASFYVIGLPVAVLAGFKASLHVKGLWIGSMCGLFCQVCILLWITLRTNWKILELSINKENEMTPVV
ncbi:hypothetical protein AQUCO_03300075v1 [Aquilegia coerulea]|uniref:MATE efflux family protein n=1 Tax=Aquilegia coerulea TaxID=218851 RepID=A0A2G5CZD0_AQUCA|nr:hypothetical protein AQUCO_03300075v1 [Aquilegia coerulea]